MSKKDKLIEEAQKLALRGQLDKAIKAYEQVLVIEPSAINHRQKMAELLIKSNRPDDARASLEIIGKHFSANGFQQRAIAIYTQIQRLFPNDIGLFITLAELNQKHGLVANALAEYKKVFEHYEKNGATAEALKILEAMQNIDPQNLTIRLKLAEAYIQFGKKDEAYAAFSKLATLFQERGDAAGFTKLNARIQQLFPEKSEFMLEVLAEQVASGNASSAVNGLQSLLRLNPNDIRVWNLIIEAYTRLKDTQRVKVASNHYLKFFPDAIAPRKALLDLAIASKDVKESLSLYDLYENDLIAAREQNFLISFLLELEKLDPINLKILDCMRRLYESTGDENGLRQLIPKIDSLRSLTEPRQLQQEPPSEETFFDEPDYFEGLETAPLLASTEAESQFQSTESIEISNTFDLPELSDRTVEPLSFGEQQETLQQTVNCDDIEIDIEIDDDLTPLFQDAQEELEPDWLDTPESSDSRRVKIAADFDSADFQAHYDLGVAFREMGLFDEAIKEFRTAAQDTMRKFHCLVICGACLRERGDISGSEKMLLSLLKPGLSIEDACLVKYELALTFQVENRHDEAAALFSEIDSAHPGFRDVRSRLEANANEDFPDFSDDELKGFDLV